MHILRKVAAILTGVAALIGGASIAAGANAADSTPFTTDELAKDQSITVQATASDANLTGSISRLFHSPTTRRALILAPATMRRSSAII